MANQDNLKPDGLFIRAEFHHLSVFLVYHKMDGFAIMESDEGMMCGASHLDIQHPFKVSSALSTWNSLVEPKYHTSAANIAALAVLPEKSQSKPSL